MLIEHFTVCTCELFVLAEIVKIEKDTEVLLVFGERVGLEMNAENQMTFLHQNTGKMYNTRRANKAKIRLELENRKL
jgi:hypothetical protein